MCARPKHHLRLSNRCDNFDWPRHCHYVIYFGLFVDRRNERDEKRRTAYVRGCCCVARQRSNATPASAQIFLTLNAIAWPVQFSAQVQADAIVKGWVTAVGVILSIV